MRHLCIGVAFVPHKQNQQKVSQSRGVRYLIALMVHSKNEVIQVEAAHALAGVALGNNELLNEIRSNPDFSYVRILKMMYSQEEIVRLLAGNTLATFAFNNFTQQRAIAEDGGVRFACFVPFLESSDEFYRCNAAFQIVVLARIIPDEEQALSSAAGIKLITDLINESKSDLIQALAADCVARLCHTRAGIPGAFISIDTVKSLCQLLKSEADQV